MSTTKRLGDLPIAVKLNLTLMVVTAIVLGTGGFLLTQWLNERLEERNLSELHRINRQVIDMIDAYAALLERSAEMLGAQFAAGLPRPLRLDRENLVSTGDANLPALRSGEQVLNNDFTLVDSFTAVTGAVATVFVRQGDDFIRIATSVKKENGERALGTPLGSKHPAYPLVITGKPYTGQATLFGREYMTRYLPLKDEAGQVIGIAFVGIDFTAGLEALKQRVRSLKIGKTGYVFALDAGREPGKAVIHPAAEGKNLIDSKDSDGRLFIKEMIDKKEGVFRYFWINRELGDKAPREKVTVLNHFPRWNWVVGSGSYLDEFIGELSVIWLSLALGNLLMLFILAGAIYFSIRRWLSLPLQKAVDAIQRVAQGNLTVTTPIHNHDEVGHLLAATEQMRQQLRHMISEVNESIDILSASIGPMAAAAQQVATQAGSQSEAAATMASAVEEMTVSIGRVSELAQEAHEMAMSSSEISDSSATVIGSAIQGISATMQESCAAVAQLGEQSQQIASIVNVIREIADQTNLLALNAAIEAARAGEQGRGFAVVADEVRKLAERTAQATQEIAAMVKQIQSGAQNAVEKMNLGVSQVEQGVELANQAGASIAEIKGKALRVGEAVACISDALREQTSASQDIARHVEKIAQQADQNHSMAQQTSATAGDLEMLAKRLQQSVARFRIASA